MKLLFAIQGKTVAELLDATHIPRAGDVVFLQLGDSTVPEIYKILHVGWDTSLTKSQSGSVPQFSESQVFILIEPATAAG